MVHPPHHIYIMKICTNFCDIFILFRLQTILQVSWVRHRDIHLLTVGRYTYTSDQRFRALHHPHSEDWILQIKYPQHRDSGMCIHRKHRVFFGYVMLNELNILGIYECQVSTSTPMSHYIHLNVIGESWFEYKFWNYSKLIWY